jgi:hypothetical protein
MVQDFYARPIDYDQLFREFMAQVSLLQERWGLSLGILTDLPNTISTSRRRPSISSAAGARQPWGSSAA